MLKLLLILSIFILNSFGTEAISENEHNIDFWTNTIDEILIHIRFNKETNELEMLPDEADAPPKSDKTKRNTADAAAVKTATSPTTLELNSDKISSSTNTSVATTSANIAEKSTTQSTTFPTTTTINPLSIDACALNCSMETPHIACGHNWSFSSSCSPTAKLINLDDFQPAILHSHNILRNQLAGNLTKFEPATRMGTTQWHPELAAYAQLNVMQCELEHDRCHNTNEFRKTGQNLAGFAWRGRQRDLKTIIIQMINNWYNEEKFAQQSDVDKYSRNSDLNGEFIAHFTAIVNELNTHVGCAALTEESGPKTTIYLACNYARNNIFRQAIYEKGETASKCLTGVNPEYTNLCSKNELYDYNN